MHVTRRHEIGGRSGVTQQNAAPSGVQCQHFLFDVVNEADRSSSRDHRNHFARVYEPWFPPQGAADLDFQRAYYNDVRNWWIDESAETPKEKPDEQFGYHVITLRHKLRVIWALADSGNLAEAESYVHRIRVWLTRCNSQPCDSRTEGWRGKLIAAISELLWTLQRLKICCNPECKNRYFFKETQIKFCSTECAWNAERLRHLERTRVNISKSRLTSAGKQKISLAQQKRWRKYRALKAKETGNVGT
jgi:hypothetical protein